MIIKGNLQKEGRTIESFCYARKQCQKNTAKEIFDFIETCARNKNADSININITGLDTK